MTRQMWFFISLCFITILCLGFLLVQLQNSGYYSIIPDKTMRVRASQKNMTIPPDAGQPCRTNEECHKKADQTGEWIDGVLIEPAISDTEIISILNSHNISSSQSIRIFQPHYIGYYIAVPELQYQHLRESIEDNRSTINLSFSSPMYAFTNPIVKKNNNSVIVPVLISYSPQMNETMTVEDLVNQGIMVKKTKVIEITLKPLNSPRDREQLLVELSRDDRVLFTYKAYLEGVLC